MQNSKSIALISVAIFVGSLALFPIKLDAATKVRSCGSQPGKSITNYLSDLVPGDTLLLDGACNEHVTIDERLYNVTIDGQGITTINAQLIANQPCAFSAKESLCEALRLSAGGTEFQSTEAVTRLLTEI